MNSSPVSKFVLRIHGPHACFVLPHHPEGMRLTLSRFHKVPSHCPFGEFRVVSQEDVWVFDHYMKGSAR